jgi:murein DD-endopeptidase MepM/ murein hydrolase activator NlpD
VPQRVVRSAIAGTVLALLAAPGLASAQSSSGGAAVPQAPLVTGVSCISTPDLACASKRAVIRGGQARIAGRSLDGAAKVVFLGRKTRRDDVAVRPSHRDGGHLDALVPSKARSGRVAVVDTMGRTATTRAAVQVVEAPAIDAAPGGAYWIGGQRKPTITLPAGATQVEVLGQDGTVVTSFPAAGATALWNGLLAGKPAPPGVYSLRSGATVTEPFTLYDHLFPIRGAHDLGRTRTNMFGGGRGHQGLDMFAACGTRIAAARGGKVQFSGYHARAGNYVVIDGAQTGNDYAYMHMRKPPLVRTGQSVFTGQALGEVGATGRASGCHLHFELWSAPGWYEGGQPFDPLPSLTRWQSYD